MLVRGLRLPAPSRARSKAQTQNERARVIVHGYREPRRFRHQLPLPSGNNLFQFGALVRVTAMHPATLIEVVVYGPASAGAGTLRRLARDRLAWVLGRRAGPSI